MVSNKDNLNMIIVAQDGGSRKSGSKTSQMEEEAYSYRRDTDGIGKYPIFLLVLHKSNSIPALPCSYCSTAAEC